MVIQHNIAANNAYRNLSMNSTGTQKNLEKLSSGFRINRSADDAAGLAISEQMRSKINGLNQATANAQDAVGLRCSYRDSLHASAYGNSGNTVR